MGTSKVVLFACWRYGSTSGSCLGASHLQNSIFIVFCVVHLIENNSLVLYNVKGLLLFHISFLRSTVSAPLQVIGICSILFVILPIIINVIIILSIRKSVWLLNAWGIWHA